MCTHIDHALNNTAYVRLLTYAAKYADRGFKASDAIKNTGVTKVQFNQYTRRIYNKLEETPDSYIITVGALTKYIELAQLAQTRESARQAQAEANSARKGAKRAYYIAIASMVITALLAIAQIVLQAPDSVRLDQKQVEKLNNAAQGIAAEIVSSQSAKLDAVAARLDKANRNLAAIRAIQEKSKEGDLDSSSAQ